MHFISWIIFIAFRRVLLDSFEHLLGNHFLQIIQDHLPSNHQLMINVLYHWIVLWKVILNDTYLELYNVLEKFITLALVNFLLWIRPELPRLCNILYRKYITISMIWYSFQCWTLYSICLFLPYRASSYLEHLVLLHYFLFYPRIYFFLTLYSPILKEFKNFSFLFFSK